MGYEQILKKFNKSIVTENKRLQAMYNKLVESTTDECQETEACELGEKTVDTQDGEEFFSDQPGDKPADVKKEAASSTSIDPDALFADVKEEIENEDGDDDTVPPAEDTPSTTKGDSKNDKPGEVVTAEAFFSEDDEETPPSSTSDSPADKAKGKKAADDFFKEEIDNIGEEDKETPAAKKSDDEDDEDEETPPATDTKKSDKEIDEAGVEPMPDNDGDDED